MYLKLPSKTHVVFIKKTIPKTVDIPASWYCAPKTPTITFVVFIPKKTKNNILKANLTHIHPSNSTKPLAVSVPKYYHPSVLIQQQQLLLRS